MWIQIACYGHLDQPQKLCLLSDYLILMLDRLAQLTVFLLELLHANSCVKVNVLVQLVD